MRFHGTFLNLVACVAVLELAAPPIAVAAVTYRVTKTADTKDGACNADCSLREAVIAANAHAGTDTIILRAGTYNLTRLGADEDAAATGDLDITDPVAISGANAPTTIIDGQGADRVLHVASSATVSGVTVRNGSAPFSLGGGIVVDSNEELTLSRSTVTMNHATAGGGIVVGQFAALTLFRTTVSHNSATGLLHANGGGIFNVEGSVTVTNSTIASNAAHAENTCTQVACSTSNVGRGGGISNAGTMTVTSSTIASNTASQRCALFVSCGGLGGNVRNTGSATFRNSIVAYGGGGLEFPAANCSSTGLTTSYGYNLESDETCSLLGATDLHDTDPLLGPLQNNGGPTWTRALAAASPAVNRAATTSVTIDQRGVPRPSGAAPDIGAYERALCRGVLVNRVGTSAGETLTGTGGSDGLLGLGGGDTLLGRGGGDGLCGVNGRDTLRGQDGNDRLDGGDGSDTLNGGTGHDKCFGGSGSDVAINCEETKGL